MRSFRTAGSQLCQSSRAASSRSCTAMRTLDEEHDDAEAIAASNASHETPRDAPWLFLFPTLMRAFPKAKFILTRQPSCEDWVYHVRGLWQWMDGLPCACAF